MWCQNHKVIFHSEIAPAHCQLGRDEGVSAVFTSSDNRKEFIFGNKLSTSCFPVGSSSPADMECGGGELSDSGSSGYWSWDHGNVSPAPSPSITEVDSSPDEGLHMELEQAEELNAKKPKVWRYVPLNDLLTPYGGNWSWISKGIMSWKAVLSISLCLSVRSSLFPIPTVSPAPHLCCVLCLTELFQRCVSVSVAQLWQGVNFFSRNKKTYPCAAPGVSCNAFDRQVQSVVCLSGMNIVWVFSNGIVFWALKNTGGGKIKI